ncbi:MAG: hypothetical protein FIB00_11935 [Chloroflexi bacterium]|nr:hypothetical protein [Dehalococcoidia bacterium]NJD65933.1 hypothetical protein [Chloroflexota bacterium]PWB44977.1 MAG: hypothetical protein C3F10_07140 [Dehalococcoidia bacterium]
MNDDMFIVTAIRTVDRNGYGPVHADAAITAAQVAGRFYNSLGLTRVFSEFGDNFRVFSPSEFAHIERAVATIDAERAAAEARKAADYARRSEALNRRKAGAA